MDFINMAIEAKSGDNDAIIALHKYYLSNARIYWSEINPPERYHHKFDEMLATVRINNTFDYLRIFVFLASLSCKQYGCHQAIILNDIDDSDKAVSTTTKVDLSYLFGHLDKIVLLTNGNGQFTFDEYLRVHYAGYELIGVPQHKAGYDNIVGCPIDFITHDVAHLRYVVGNEYISEYLRPSYDVVNSLTTPDKGLLLMVIWMYIHENGFKESFHRKIHPFAYRNRIEFLSSSLRDEFRKYHDIIINIDNVNDTLNNLAKYLSQYTKEYYILKKYQLGLIDDISFTDIIGQSDSNINGDYINFLLGLNYAYHRII